MNGQLAVALTMSVVLGFYGTVAEAMHEVAQARALPSGR
jgi:hypothetical protein